MDTPTTQNETAALKNALVDDDEEWHIVSDWSNRVAICGCELPGKHVIPADEVPDSDTCGKCLSVEQSVLYRFGKAPLMRCKVWLVG